jgi:hypothetical protein
VVVSAAHFKEVTNGYEQQTDGLWVHRGVLNAGTLRARNLIAPRSGEGVETQYDQLSHAGHFLAYNRDTAQYTDLNISAKNLYLNTFGGTLNLPDGSVQTADLAPGAAQASLGSWIGTPSWSTPGVGINCETPIQVTTGATTSGATIRVELTTAIANNTVGGFTYVGIGTNGAVQIWNTGFHTVAVNYVVPLSIVYYFSGTGGSMKFSMFVHLTAGVTTFFSGNTSSMFVYEQRR